MENHHVEPGGIFLKNIEYQIVNKWAELPSWADPSTLNDFLHYKMQPYHDTLADVRRGLDYALSESKEKGGFLIVAGLKNRLLGVVVILRTGMRGFVPENLLLFVAVEPELRSRGIGRNLIERALKVCEGNVKLHVEPDNPALRLYERIGFTNKYLEMRYEK